jgi:hypothetical protein
MQLGWALGRDWVLPLSNTVLHYGGGWTTPTVLMESRAHGEVIGQQLLLLVHLPLCRRLCQWGQRRIQLDSMDCSQGITRPLVE